MQPTNFESLRKLLDAAIDDLNWGKPTREWYYRLDIGRSHHGRSVAYLLFLYNDVIVFKHEYSYGSEVPISVIENDFRNRIITIMIPYALTACKDYLPKLHPIKYA